MHPGFPESHAASFALLVYASCWLDAMNSGWDCALEGEVAPPAVRPGFRLITGMKEASARRIEAARAEASFDSADDLARRAQLQRDEMTLLAAADALATLSGHRRAQVWEASALRAAPLPLRHAPINEEDLELPEAPEGQAILWDYNATGLTLRRHPLALLRQQFWKRGYLTAKQLKPIGDGVRVQTCGIVTLRQQPETAKGVIFVSLEDETGVVQVICWRHQGGAAGGTASVTAVGAAWKVAA